MTYAVEIVIRKKGNMCYSGFASEYPINKGFRPIESYGKWYGSQMGFKPFVKALESAIQDYLDSVRLAKHFNEW